MKPDWDQLSEMFNTPDSNAQICDVDCTDDRAKNLCPKYAVKSFPSLRYFQGKDTSDKGAFYEGARDFTAFKKFVSVGSKLPCVSATLEHCSLKEQSFVEEVRGWDIAKFAEEEKNLEEALAAARKLHEDEQAVFEEQKAAAVETQKRIVDAKKALDKITKDTKYKIGIVKQGPPEITEAKEEF